MRRTIVFIAALFKFGCAARILGVVPTPSYSHQVVFRPIWRELSLKGHKLTVLTTDPMNNASLTNLTEIDLSFAYDLWNVKHNIAELIYVSQINFLEYIDRYVAMVDDIVDQELQHPQVRNLIRNQSEHFDLLMLEYPYPLLTMFSERFGCPFIGMTSLDAHSTVYDSVGNPSHPVLNPDFSLPFGGTLSLWERLLSVAFQIYTRFYVHFYSNPKQDMGVKKHFGEGYPTVEDVTKRVSMLFVNVYPLFHNVRPLVPAVVQIGGGTHLKERRPLPHDLQKFLDDAPEGCVYLSLGTNVKSKYLPERARAAILQAFSELPYRVLWKYESDYFEKSAKIRTAKWFPQQDVLGHPNVKLFVTQGGLQSMEEAIYNYVPLIGIPFYADQYANVALMTAKGFGSAVDYKTITKDSFKGAISEVIENPSYREKIEASAKLALDQPTTGLERAVWWTEYVLRNKGATHLRSPAIDLPLYQYLLLDVVGFCSIAILIVVLSVYTLIKLIFCRRAKIKTE